LGGSWNHFQRVPSAEGAAGGGKIARIDGHRKKKGRQRLLPASRFRAAISGCGVGRNLSAFVGSFVRVHVRLPDEHGDFLCGDWMMIRRLFLVSLASGGVATAVFQGSAAMQSGIRRMIYGVVGWDAAAREADPMGYCLFLQSQLREDVSEIQAARQSLGSKSAGLGSELTRLLALESQAVQIAAECRAAWQRDVFPALVADKAFTREALETFTAKILERHRSVSADRQRVQETQQLVNEQQRRLTDRIERTRATLVLLETHTQLFAARGLTGDVRPAWLTATALLAETSTAEVGEPDGVAQSGAGQPTSACSAQGLFRAMDFLQGRVKFPCPQ
jgi:hypothetical protein